MPKNHVIISGTGRSGTTFLVQLFTELGLDTGFTSSDEQINDNCNAGMEWDILQPGAPYIAKSPWLCETIEDILQNSTIHIEHAIIPVRDLFAAAESRRFVSSKSAQGQTPNIVPGGVWDTKHPQEQEKVLSQKFYTLLFGLIKNDVPVTFLFFPKLVHQPVYLYSKLWFLLKDISYEIFIRAFKKVCQPELVHEFHPKSEA